MKRIYFTVTNDLSYDQRMDRICTSLSNAGYQVTLVGREVPGSLPLQPKTYRQDRLRCLFHRGFLFYAEFNIRLFFYLSGKKMDAICAIDLDTIIPCSVISSFKKCQRVYDAHELFCEMKEVAERPLIRKFWKWVERTTVPHFKWGYTVNEPIRAEFEREYGVQYSVIMNAARRRSDLPQPAAQPFVLYQGAVNEGRSFETLIPAFQWIGIPLWIYGDGNFLPAARSLVATHNLEQKVFFKGKLPPAELQAVTSTAALGITLFEKKGLNNYWSLANRFFDYLQAGVPQICVDYPVYRELNDRYGVAFLVHDLSARALADTINWVWENKDLLQQLRQNCLEARQVLNWEQEEKKLLEFYQNVFARG